MKAQIKLFIGIVSMFLAGWAFAAETQPVMDNKSCDPPKYPKAALMNEETGTVVMQFVVGADGKVVDSKVDKSSGSKSLDKAALSALSLCKFKPGTKDGKAEQMSTKVEFVWKLE